MRRKICSGCLADLLWLLWRTVHLFMSVPKAPTAQLPDPLSLSKSVKQRPYSVSRAKWGQKVCVCVCVRVHYSLSIEIFVHVSCWIALFLCLSDFFCVCECLSYVTPPDARGIPTRFYASLLSGKLCSAQRTHFTLGSLEDYTSKYDSV